MQNGLKKIQDSWQQILDYIIDNFGDDISSLSLETWIEPLVIHSCDKHTAVFIVPDPFTKTQLEKRYSKVLRVAIGEVTGMVLDIVFCLQSEIDEKNNSSDKDDKRLIRRPEDVSIALINKANLNPKYTFENFVVGPNNQFAHAAAVAVAERPGQEYKILYIYGGVGLGKTHLMHAVAHYILKNNPKSNILYTTSETFTNDYIESIRNNNPAKFRSKYRDLDVLLIDDIQFIIGKESTQEEFFHTFNALNEKNKQIIISSDKPPKEIDNLEERLRSRFEWGMMVDIKPPNYETRMAILRNKESLEGYNVDDSVIDYIASNIKSNIRELEGALTRVVAKSKLEHITIDVQMAEQILSDYIGSADQAGEVTPSRIIKTVAEHYNIPYADICSIKKSKEIAYPRQIAMYLCRTFTNATLNQIGKELGGRDHTTIMHGALKIENELNSGDEKLQATIDILKKKILPQ